MTLANQLKAGLLALGSKRVDGRSRYDEFTHFLPFNPNKLFVGLSGALRIGPNASKSQSIGCPMMQSAFYKRVLEAGKGGVA